MNARAVQCARCRQPLLEAAREGQFTRCPACGREQQLLVFPALVREPDAAAGAALAPGESACYYHEEKRAVVACDLCGRFLCPLCDVPLGQQHFCPVCLDRQTQKGRLSSFERGRFLSHEVALWLAVFNLAFGWCLLLPGLAAVILGLRGWLGPKAVYRRSKGPDRAVAGAAMVLAAGGMAGWLLVVIGWVRSW